MLVSKSGQVSPLEPGPDGAATVVPTFTPAQFERMLNTRAATSSVERRQRTMNARLCLFAMLLQPLQCSQLMCMSSVPSLSASSSSNGS